MPNVLTYSTHNLRGLRSLIDALSPETKECLVLFGAQLVLYCLLTLNFIAIAHLNYLGTAVTDGLVASVNFLLIRKVVKSSPDSWKPWAAYTSGGIVGSMIGIAVSAVVR